MMPSSLEGVKESLTRDVGWWERNLLRKAISVSEPAEKEQIRLLSLLRKNRSVF
jgi:hypothetical protein